MKLINLSFFIFLSYCAWSQTAKRGELVRINGTRLFVKTTGNGEHLLVIHGGPGLNHAYFIPHLSEIEKKYSIIYYDQRACGRSLIPSVDSISIKFLVDDIEAIRQKFNIAKLNILSHSWGSVLATHYSLAYPDRVKKLIVSDPAMFSREYDEQAAALIAKKSTKEDSVARAQIMGKASFTSSDYEELFLLSFRSSAYRTENLSKIQLKLPDNFGEANNTLFTALMKDQAMNVNLYDSLSSLKFPVLIIHGAADVIPLSSIERLDEQLLQSELVVFKESGHFPFVEEKALYNSTVIEFLKKK